MFEIRIICDPADSDRVTTALTAAFTTGAVHQRPTRDGKRTRLYLTADHRPDPGPWPTPDEAYALAPSIISEIGWTTRTIADAECYTALDREYYLRKAALLDRIALLDEPDEPHGDATETAEAAAVALVLHDDVYDTGPHESAADCTARAYVRREYTRHIRTHTESE